MKATGASPLRKAANEIENKILLGLRHRDYKSYSHLGPECVCRHTHTYKRLKTGSLISCLDITVAVMATERCSGSEVGGRRRDGEGG